MSKYQRKKKLYLEQRNIICFNVLNSLNYLIEHAYFWHDKII